jgi:hypothetical protein
LAEILPVRAARTTKTAKTSATNGRPTRRRAPAAAR